MIFLNQNNKDMPLGFQMALSKNFCAMKYFTNRSEKERLQIIEKAKTMNSKAEMESYVKELGNIY